MTKVVLPRALSEEQWEAAQPSIAETFPRITIQDLRDCDRRVDLLVAKVQNRHWVDLVEARRSVYAVLSKVVG